MTKIDLQMFALTTIPTGLVEKAWGKDLWTQAMNNLYFTKFMGNDSNAIIQKDTNLKKEAGDTIIIPLQTKLKEAGVLDDAQLEGNEEALNFYDFPVPVHEYAHAVKLKGRLEEQKTSINLRTAAKNGLATWLQEKVDNLIFSALTDSPTANRVVYAGAATSESALADTDVFTADLIGKAKRKAQFANIQPVIVDGKPHYVMVLSPYQSRDLKKDAAWIDAQKYAGIRGEDNPIFSGALGVYDGVVIHESEGVPITQTGTGSANVGHAILMGRQAGVMAVAQETTWDEDPQDYKRKYGVAISTILGIAKSKFNGEDFATINVLTGAKAD